MSLESLHYFREIAQEFANIILKEDTARHLEAKALEFLFLASIQGHQCVTIEHDILYPSVQDVLYDDGVDIREIKEGFNQLRALLNAQSIPPVVVFGQSFYLQKNYQLERGFIEQLCRFINAPVAEQFSCITILNAVDVYRAYLNQEQLQAIESALQGKIHIISGGPGTGKSYTAFYLLKVFFELMQEKKKTPKVLVMAPTGKAVSVLSQRLAPLKDLGMIEIATLHKSLKTAFKKHSKYQDLIGYDLIILDEASMVDLDVFHALLRSMPLGARLILMGDHHQLPPVESGMVLHHLVKALPHTLLKESKRVHALTLLDLAEKIKKQDEQALEYLKQGHVQYIECNELETLETIVEKTPQIQWSRSMLLTPMRQGRWGVESLNQAMLKLYEKSSDSKIPILVTKNQYDLEIFNGDIGYLDSVEDLCATFPGSEERTIPLCLIHQWTHAFSLTIHKSQGSEYDCVVLFLPKGSEVFGKELLYTGVTRAKKQLTIIASEGVFLECLKKNGCKHSCLSDLLVESIK